MANIVASLILISLSMVFIFLASGQYSGMQSEARQQVPEEQRTDPMFWGGWSKKRFLQAAGRSSPDSPFRTRATVLAGIAVSCLCAAILVLLARPF